MPKYFVQFFWILALSMATVKAINEEYLIQSERLPDIANPIILANGHLGYGYRSNRLELNCIFNGKGGNSERARIPNWGNVNVSSVLDSNQKDRLPDSNTLYTMDTRTGVFEWESNITSLNLRIVQRTYAHRFYNRGLVYELRVYRTKAQEPLKIQITQSPGGESKDMRFFIITNNNEWKVMKGFTKEREDDSLQKSLRTVFVVQSENLENGKTLEMGRGQYELFYRFILTADEKEAVAKNEAKQLMELSPKQIMDDHVKEWNSFWQSFNVDIVGNLELSKIVNAGMFYMASALPSSNTFQRNDEFCGLSPNGIGQAKNIYDIGEGGNTYWDTEQLMLPVVTQFSYKWARELFQYRRNRLEAARINANSNEYPGAKYPWRSGFTGIETNENKHLYVSAGIIASVQNYFEVSNDVNWLCETAWPMVREIAEFLASLVSWDSATSQYHINDVESPGLYSQNNLVNNSVYVNAVTKIALQFASYVSNTCHNSNEINTEWKNIADNIFIPYVTNSDYHPQSTDYAEGDSFQEPDVVLLGYPLQYPMNISTRINDINLYEAVTSDLYSRTWPIFVINFLDINETAKANSYFEKSYKNYVFQDFKIWNSVLTPKMGTSNFHTGFAAFFQSIMNGYAGIRFHSTKQNFVMEIKKRHLLPDTDSFKIHGISFAGSTFDLSINNAESSTLSCIRLGDKALELVQGNRRQHVYEGLSIELGTEAVYIQSNIPKRF